MALHATLRVLCSLSFASLVVGQSPADSLEKRDSPTAVCTFDNSTNGAPIGRDPTCDYGCNEEGCDTSTVGLIFGHFTGATYPKRTIRCGEDDCQQSGTKVASLPYGVTGNISSAGLAYYAPEYFSFGCQAKLKGDATARVATLDALFPQLKKAGSDVRRALAKITSLPVQCNATVAASNECSPSDPTVCQYKPDSVTQVGGAPLPSGVVIRPVDGIGLPVQSLHQCTFDIFGCVKAANVSITKVPTKLGKHGLCAKDVRLLVDDFTWASL